MTAALAAVVGLAVGSFLNVVAHRVPRGMSLWAPRSHCPGCGVPLRARDNVPLLSYLALRGRCRACQAPIGLRYPALEALTGALFAAATLRFARPEEAAFVAAAGSVLLVLAVIDLEHRKVPNRIVLPATAGAVAWVAAMGLAAGPRGSVVSALGSGAAGFALLLGIAVVSGGMGYGDVKLAGFIGVTTGWFGWDTFALALFAGFVLGGLVALGLLASGRRSRKDAIPFAPMLCAGALVALFVGGGPVRALVSP